MCYPSLLHLAAGALVEERGSDRARRALNIPFARLYPSLNLEVERGYDSGVVPEIQYVKRIQSFKDLQVSDFYQLEEERILDGLTCSI